MCDILCARGGGGDPRQNIMNGSGSPIYPTLPTKILPHLNFTHLSLLPPSFPLPLQVHFTLTIHTYPRFPYSPPFSAHLGRLFTIFSSGRVHFFHSRLNMVAEDTSAQWIFSDPFPGAFHTDRVIWIEGNFYEEFFAFFGFFCHISGVL